MNQIQIFQNQEFGAIRTMTDEQGDVLFCAKDVAEALGYKLARKAVQDHVDKGDVLKWNTPTTSGNQLMTYINESGLYALILSSKLESA
jgi:prophage antirepressor-like protein